MCIVNFYAHSRVPLHKIIQNDIIIAAVRYYIERRKLARARVERKKKQKSADND